MNWKIWAGLSVAVLIGIAILFHHAARPSVNDFELAVAKNDVERVKKMIGDGADLNAPGRLGSSPLQMALWHQQTAMAKLLIDAGADVNKTSVGDSTALFIAAGSRNAEIVNLLISKGANVNIRAGKARTPLLNAAALGDVPIIEALLAAGADATVKDEDGHGILTDLVNTGPPAELVQRLIEKGAKVDEPDRFGNTPLRNAAVAGALEAMDALIKAGANVEARRQDKNTVLIEAAVWGSKPEILEKVLRKLMDAGADINARNYIGATALYSCAVSATRTENLKVLLKLGANPLIKANNGMTPQQAATRAEQVENAKVLEENDRTNAPAATQQTIRSTSQ